MTDAPIVLGLDPGFSRLGYALVELTADGERILDMGVICTKKSGKKLHVRATDDNVRRAGEIAEALDDLIGEKALDNGRNLVAICAEAMSFPRASSVAAKVALAWGVVVALAHVAALPIRQCTPQELKRAVCGRVDASKEDVELALKQRYGADAIEAHTDGLGKLREHPIDALAAIVTCLDSDVIKLARRMVAA